MQIIGREKEKKILKRIFHSADPEFLVIYGRRRVGKIHLIREFFSTQKGVYFELTGKKDGTTQEHLVLFARAFGLAFAANIPPATPKSWDEGLLWLTEQMEAKPQKEKIVLFSDFRQAS